MRWVFYSRTICTFWIDVNFSYLKNKHSKCSVVFRFSLFAAHTHTHKCWRDGDVYSINLKVGRCWKWSWAANMVFAIGTSSIIMIAMHTLHFVYALVCIRISVQLCNSTKYSCFTYKVNINMNTNLNECERNSPMQQLYFFFFFCISVPNKLKCIFEHENCLRREIRKQFWSVVSILMLDLNPYNPWHCSFR